MPTCRDCQTEFTVEPADKEILAKLDLPEPQLCFEHALQRRMSFRNERHLYRHTCGLCDKPVLAMYAPNLGLTIYCRDCWFSDSWNPSDYGRNYDPNRSFLDQWAELIKITPQFNLFHVGEIENCDYNNFTWNSKDCYLCFSCLKSEGCVYCKNNDECRDCVDSLYIAKSELAYDCVDITSCYQSAWLTRCEKSTECYLSRDLFNCQNCFGCVNLKHKQYYWYNEPINKNEYERRIKEALSTRENFAQHQKTFAEHEQKHPVEFAVIRNSENATGNSIYNSKSIRNSFGVREGENMGDVYRVTYDVKDSYRINNLGIVELAYEAIAAGLGSNKVVVSWMGEKNFSASYTSSCTNCEELLGCVGLRNKKFCILNKQYDEATYHALKKQIIDKMKADGEWGENLAPALIPQNYNDSIAQELFPLSKAEVLAKGWKWSDDQGMTRGKETMKPEALPNSISATPESILKEILACVACQRNYRIQPKELAVLKTLGLALPTHCQDCRFDERLKRYYFPRTYDRQCMCSINSHNHHTSATCQTTFKTTYAPNRPEKVFCSPCYQAELR